MATLAQASRPGGAAVATDVVGADRGDIEQPSRRAYEEEIPGLQSRVNELTEACRIQGAQLRDLNAALAASLQTMNANVVLAAEKFSQAIGEASQLHERMLTSKAQDSSRVRECDVAAGAGSFDEKAPWCEEKKCILRDLCDSVDSCKFSLDDIKYFQSVPLPRTRRPELTLVPRALDEPTAGSGESCSASCGNVDEILYWMLLSSTEELPTAGNPVRLFSHLLGRDTWLSIKVDRRSGYDIVVNFSWGEKQINTNSFPEIVRVKALHGRGSVDLTREPYHYEEWRQIYVLTQYTRCEIDQHLLFEIAIKF